MDCRDTVEANKWEAKLSATRRQVKTNVQKRSEGTFTRTGLFSPPDWGLCQIKNLSTTGRSSLPTVKRLRDMTIQPLVSISGINCSSDHQASEGHERGRLATNYHMYNGGFNLRSGSFCGVLGFVSGHSAQAY